MESTCTASLSLALVLSCCLAWGCTRCLWLHRWRCATPQTASLMTMLFWVTLHPVLASLLDSSKRLRSSVPPRQQCSSMWVFSWSRMCLFASVLVCFKKRGGGERGGDTGVCRFYKTDSWFSACAFSNPLMFAPLGYRRVKFQKGALH